jgi:mannosylglycerate hydrolase
VTLTRQRDFTILDEHHKEIPFSILSQEEEDAGLTDRQVAARLMDIKVYRSRLLLRVEKMDGLSVKYLQLQEERTNVRPIMKVEKALIIENLWGVLRVEGNQISYQDKITGIHN